MLSAWRSEAWPERWTPPWGRREAEGEAGREGRWWQFVIESVSGGGDGVGGVKCLSSLDSQVDCI